MQGALPVQPLETTMRALPTVMALAALLGTQPAFAEFVTAFDFPQPKDTSEFYTVMEIPAGSITKYEIDAETGHVVVDRYQSMPVVYPANYGSVTSSLGGDGDPLDALVFTREPVVPGALIKVRAIGVLNMVDGGEADDKIIAVPATDIDPQYDGVKTIDDLPAIERQRIEAFFRVYKQLPEGRKAVELNGFGGANVAIDMVGKAIESYRNKKD
ncbi:inorganic diphosphatase [Mesorhizobium sp. M0915]|uniref:inorganic diphosphatase n=1 Tax=Mesorhizobium sp. M0915 TaxID=2957027 RepID=UPI003335F129